jgi:hypothetical protein
MTFVSPLGTVLAKDTTDDPLCFKSVKSFGSYFTSLQLATLSLHFNPPLPCGFLLISMTTSLPSFLTVPEILVDSRVSSFSLLQMQRI